MLAEIRARAVGGHERVLADAMHPVLARIYAARGVKDRAEVDLALSALPRPAKLKHIDQAAAIISDAVMAEERIVVVGDFDADGASGTALGVLALQSFGAEEVGFLVPNRFEFGHGLSTQLVKVASELEPDLLVTVDHGVASLEGIQFARKLGMRVVVTDHHLAGEALPDADAIVNPNQPGCEFESKCLAGVGVLFYVMSAVRAELARRDWFGADRPMPNMADLLDLVAIGTISDLVPFDRTNRILVSEGLRRASIAPRPGVRALLEVAKRGRTRVLADDIGYGLAPRINAAGRLTDMSLGIQCLLSQTLTDARRIAGELDQLNRRRKEIESSMVMRAEHLLRETKRKLEGKDLPAVICLYDADFSQGVIGLVASRLARELERPAFVFADAGDAEPDYLRGSARGVPGFHLLDLIDLVNTRRPGLLVRYGGHAMAAGVTLVRANLAEFAESVQQVVCREMHVPPPSSVYLTDGTLHEDQLCLDFARELENAGPWGQGFEQPTFEGVFSLRTQRVVADAHLRMLLEQGQTLIDAIAFGQDELIAANRVRIGYRLSVHRWGDSETAQLIVERLEPLDA